jgi:predicted aconitase with swiveling domain
VALTSKARVLIDGAARGPLLRLKGPISFWGGVDPQTGQIADPRHPDYGASISGTVLAIAETIGSSSSSSVMLELIGQGRAPAALLLGETDAILTLGVVIAREMAIGSLPVLQLPIDELPEQGEVTIREGGAIVIV